MDQEPDDSSDGEGRRKKQRNDDEPKVTESILDDIRLEDIESRITVHVLDSPQSCTHEVAVYPGKRSDTHSCDKIQIAVNVIFKIGS